MQGYVIRSKKIKNNKVSAYPGSPKHFPCLVSFSELPLLVLIIPVHSGQNL